MYLTRNQAYGFPVPWVRIPPSPPKSENPASRQACGVFVLGLRWGRRKHAVRRADRASTGLTPRTRRKLIVLVLQDRQHGSISAHAEETSRWHRDTRAMEAYLRARGGNAVPAFAFQSHVGLSPRTRRKRLQQTPQVVFSRSISAHAEETFANGVSRESAGVYLRARGGNPSEASTAELMSGLSPRTRRKPDDAVGSDL